MERLLTKFDTARRLVPAPLEPRGADHGYGALYYGSTSPAMDEAVDALQAHRAMHLDTLRLRAYPFPDAVRDFILAHERVFLVEQNRDAQLRSLLIERSLRPRPRAHRAGALHYDGTPITARFIGRAIADTCAPRWARVERGVARVPSGLTGQCARRIAGLRRGARCQPPPTGRGG